LNLATKSLKEDMGNVILLYVNEAEAFSHRICSNNRYKIVLLKEGTISINLNSHKHTLTAPCLLYFNERDSIELLSHNSMKACTVYFHPNVVNSELDFNTFSPNAELISERSLKETSLLHSFYKVNGFSHPFIDLSNDDANKINTIILNMNRELTHQYDGYWTSRSRSYLIQLLFFLKSLANNNSLELKRNIPDNFQLQLVNKVKLFLTHHYDEKILLDDLALQFGINKRSLNRLFLQYTGLSSNKFLIQYRVEIAASLLKNTYLPILEIANRTGFSDISYFGKVFRKYNGIAPKDYRNIDE